MLLKETSSILFVGTNPGLQTIDGFVGSPRNQYFNLIRAAGFRNITNDQEMHDTHNVNFMNYVDRAIRSDKDLANDELAVGKERLITIVGQYRPRLICFVGKKCCKYSLYIRRTNNNIEYG